MGKKKNKRGEGREKEGNGRGMKDAEKEFCCAVLHS